MENKKANRRQLVEMYNLNKMLQGIRDSASAKVDSNVAEARRLYALDAARKQNKMSSKGQPMEWSADRDLRKSQEYGANRDYSRQIDHSGVDTGNVKSRINTGLTAE